MKKYAILLIIIGIMELVIGALVATNVLVPSPTSFLAVSKKKKGPTPTPTNIPVFPSNTPISEQGTTAPSNTTAAANYPAQVVNLTNWKLTLPTGENESPTEIKQLELSTYKNDPWFVTTDSGKAIRFRAPVNGVTTSGSGYPRSELREMVQNGQEKASWSSNQGVHTMFLDEAITAVPQIKQHVVAGQIHDADDDVIVIRLEFPKLYVNVDGKNVVTLDENYTLGKRFTIQFVVKEGKTMVYYNGNSTPSHTLDKKYTDAYFKAGAYTQSNCDKEKSSSLCNADNFGEVVIYKLEVTHQ